MATIKLVIKARIEELPTLAQFSIDSYIRDKADFMAYKPAKYIASYAADLAAKKLAVAAVVNPKQLTAELALITLRLSTNIIAVRPLMDRLEGYVRDAVGLTVLPKNFGIKEVRKKITSDDQEGLDGALLYLEGNIGNNMPALTAVGYSVPQQTQLTTLHGKINLDNAAQNAKMSARALLVVQNMGIINDLAKTLKDLWADGKSLYKSSDKVRLKDYTNSQLINRIRAEELKTKIAGVVKDATGTGRKAKVVAKPVIGGRGKTVNSKTNGEYELKGLKAGFYNITVTIEGVPSFVVQGEARSGETVVLDLVAPV
ncbi:MAG: carboxypeptidase regulatory-like domain-containing protein [Bacteroidia bacterium]|nr:carboxypeptidase regulatory-like domain-containing protein [Bacteroidia bacterium]